MVTKFSPKMAQTIMVMAALGASDLPGPRTPKTPRRTSGRECLCGAIVNERQPLSYCPKCGRTYDEAELERLVEVYRD